jgi:proline dehydrogenase
MVDFNNTKQAFVLKSNRQLKKAKFLYGLVGSPALVKFGKKSSELAMRLGLPIRSIIKSTVYDQFVGGETIAECRKVIEEMHAHGVLSLLDYSIEGKATEADFDNTAQKIIETIRFGKETKGVPFCVFKVTGVARFALLEKVSAKGLLSSTEVKEWGKARARVKQICQEAYDHKVWVLIDAEESWAQPAIDELAEEMMQHFNRERTVVFNTLQMYRVDRLEYLEGLHQRLREKNLYGGVKLVRGAYMEKERERARYFEQPSPIQPTKEASDKNFNAGLKYVMDHLDEISLVAGSHNEESTSLLTELISKKGIENNDPRVWFSQLYGMSDHLSFNLAADGYNVVKYLPFGPVRETLPYLIRRAEENSSASGQTSRELSLIEQEMKRRGI